MAGLKMICKLCGGLRVKDEKGNVVEYVWDYKNDRAVTKAELTAERKAASEKAKWEKIQAEIKQGKLEL